jgi:hypothetical protein
LIEYLASERRQTRIQLLLDGTLIVPMMGGGIGRIACSIGARGPRVRLRLSPSNVPFYQQ